MKHLRYIDSVLQTWVLVFTILFVVFVGSGVEVLTANASDFSAALSYTLAVLLGLSLLISALALMLAVILPNSVRRTINSLLLPMTCLVWLQSTLFVWDYGLLDGSDLLWDQHSYQGVLELVLWLSLAAIAFAKRASLIRRWKIIASFVLLASLLGASVTSIRRASAFAVPTYVISDDRKFSFSKDENIIYFLLDGFQSDVFQYLLDSNPELEREFAGFTFYRNTVSAFAKTYPTIPLLLTGNRYRNDLPLNDFIEGSFAAGSVPQHLKETGWDVGLFPLAPRTIPLDGAIASNFVPDVGLREIFDEALTVIDISLFRAVPHFVKPFVYNEGSWFTQRFQGLQRVTDAVVEQWGGRVVSLPRTHIHPEINFLNHMTANIDGNNERSVFRFFHHYMPHAPFVLDRELNFGELEGDTDEAYYEYSLASIRLLLSYFSLLEREGVFANATIIVSSDHGGGEYSRTMYRSEEGWESEPLLGALDGAHAASGRALLLIKEQGASEAMTVSDRPLSLSDIASTIARYAGIDRRFGGTPAQDIEDDAVRERLYSYYAFEASSDYLGDVTEYVINGHVWEADSWRRTGVVLSQANEAQIEEKYAFGKRLRFGANENNVYLLSGWSHPEPGLVWSHAREATLSIPLEQAPEIGALYTLTLEGIPFVVGEELPYQVLEVSIGNYRVESVMSEAGEISLVVPGEALLQNPTVIGVGFPLAMSPFSLRRSFDQRELGLGLKSLSIRESTFVPLRCGESLDFSSSDESRIVAAAGLSQVEDWGRWTDGRLSSLQFLFEEESDCDASELTFRAMGYVNELNPRVISEVALNGLFLGQCSFDYLEGGRGPRECTFRVPEGVLAQDGMNRVELRHQGIRSPKELGLSADGRMLGLGLIELVIR